jgi:hypothetical protein
LKASRRRGPPDIFRLKRWRIVEGDLPQVFTTSTRKDFRPPHSHYIGASEFGGGDKLTAVVESPAFELAAGAYCLVMSGGHRTEKTFVAVIDAANGQTLFWTGENGAVGWIMRRD